MEAGGIFVYLGSILYCTSCIHMSRLVLIRTRLIRLFVY